ncbi:GNAT family N-acetyltransferase [Candidatus Dojkabacteria bacterium]|nr:GNAT family N-acetyltransferase [Candidatus Dojkabacteria bacterium]
MKIMKFSPKYIDEMARLFAEAFSEPECEWDIPTAKAYLERDYKYYPDYCLMAINKDQEIMGAVFCAVDPYFRSRMLLVDSLQVKSQFRKQGVAKALLREVFEKAKNEDFRGVHFLADETVDFPRGWYERLGFKKSCWTEYEADMSAINFELLKE